MKKKVIAFVTVIILAAIAAVITLVVNKGDLTFKSDVATIDASKAKDGYVRVKYTGDCTTRIKVQVVRSDGLRQNYNLNMDGEYETFPLHAGGGTYVVRVAEQVEGTDYKVAFYASFYAPCDDKEPFAAKNQYVNWEKGGIAETRAKELAGNADSMTMDNLAPETSREARIVGTCSAYVAYTITYVLSDEATISGYIPDPDRALDSGSGTCLDYASALCAMLRSQKIPAKLVVGWAGEVYHAWVDAYFDGDWHLLDPTFTSNAKGDEKVLDFINNRDNYTQRYVY